MSKKLLYTNFFLAQLFFILFICCTYLYPTFEIGIFVIFFIMLFETVANIYFFRELNRLDEKEQEVQVAKVELEQSQKFINSIRAKHHDFVNHLQVIMGLVQLNNTIEVVSYIKDLSKDLIEIEKLISLKKPEIAALISSKIGTLSYMKVNLNIRSNLEHLVISPKHIVSIIGNLLDNAIFEASFRDEKWLEIDIKEDEYFFIFTISNSGNMSNETKEKIFKAGYTTKGNKGTGMGLYIVNNLVEKYNGKLSVDNSDSAKVSFLVKLPKDKNIKNVS